MIPVLTVLEDGIVHRPQRVSDEVAARLGASAEDEGELLSSGELRPAVPASVDGVLCDAEQATVPKYDDGLLRGDGAFEFMRCYAARLFALTEHLDRMARTCATIRLPFHREQLEAEIAALLAWAGRVFMDMRIVLTRGGRRIVILEPYLDWPPAHLAFVTDSPRAVIAGAKSLSCAGNMLAKRLAGELGFWEALLTTLDGRVMEVQQAAYFWVTPQSDLCTPPLSEGILDSITRRVVMKRLAVEERVWPARHAKCRRSGSWRAGSSKTPPGRSPCRRSRAIVARSRNSSA